MELPASVSSETIKRMRIAVLLFNQADRLPLAEIEAKVEHVLPLDATELSVTEVMAQVNTQLAPKSAVALRYHNHCLYFMDDVYCAQLKIHPHAYVCGLSTSSSIADAQQAALAQAKRKLSQVVVKPYHSDSVQSEFDAFVESVSELASRTLIANDGTENYWFVPQHQPRILQLNVHKPESAMSLVLVQGSGILSAKPLLHQQQLFFVISANSIDEIINKTQLLNKDISCPQSLACNDEIALMKKHLLEHKAQSLFALVLQATSVERLQQEIQQFLITAKAQQANQHWHWQTPNGSCFYANAGDYRSGLTFVYPGVGTTYPNMLATLHQYFPALFQQLETKLDLKTLLQADCFYAETNRKPSLSQLAISGVGVSYLLTQLLMDEFKLKPQFALGYSMGETAMWASLGVWQQPESLIEKTANSDIFNQQISGELTAVRSYWQLKQNEPITWNSFVVRCSAEKINALLTEYPKAYLVITQGDTCIIAGDEQQCRQLLEHLGKRGLASNMVTAMHTPAAAQVYDALQEFYRLPLTTEQPEISFISAGVQQVITNPDSHSIAQSIANTFTETLDFSDVISTAIDNGSKLFLEIGADRQTASIISKLTSNQHQVHALAINSKAQATITSLLKCIAQLISLRVPISLQPLIPRNNIETRMKVTHQKERVL